MIYTTHYESPLGDILLAAKEEKLIGLWIQGQEDYLKELHEEICINDHQDIFVKAKDWLDQYFAGKQPDICSLELNPFGSDFRKKVWKILMEIPYGKVMTYQDIAKRIAKEMGKVNMSAQAVGGAVGHNPISIIIPCHRVVGTSGNLTGYHGGIDIKQKLLILEGHDLKIFTIPKEK